jgi:uncharacterized membrane protein YozB (DUF420 family)
MELLQIFPHLNALLNAISGILLLFGFYFILSKQVRRHRSCMLAASTVSAIFLISYISHHIIRSYFFGIGPTKFTGTGLARPIYFTVLTSHTVLAAVIAPFVVLTLWRALKSRFQQHKNIARLVYPVWLYVSITGVIVYVMLYHLYPNR